MKQNLLIFPEHILDDKFKGKYTKQTSLTINQPRKWTQDEINHVLKLKKLGYNNDYIAQCIDRDNVSVQIKLKRLKKKNDTYNTKHRDEKYNLNNKFLDILKPKSVLDLYAGENSFYKNKVDKLITNDKNENFNCDYNMKADLLLAKLYSEKNKFDIIDIDPFGSGYECFELAFRMIKKGLIITLGEFGHIRWKRLDFVNKKYNINNFKDFTIENINNKIIEKAKQNDCNLKVLFSGNFTNIKRTYFVKE